MVYYELLKVKKIKGEMDLTSLASGLTLHEALKSIELYYKKPYILNFEDQLMIIDVQDSNGRDVLQLRGDKY